MKYNPASDDDYLAMSELSREIGTIVQKNLEQGLSDLTDSDIEHIVKMTSDVTLKIKSQMKEITV